MINTKLPRYQKVALHHKLVAYANFPFSYDTPMNKSQFDSVRFLRFPIFRLCLCLRTIQWLIFEMFLEKQIVQFFWQPFFRQKIMFNCVSRWQKKNLFFSFRMKWVVSKWCAYMQTLEIYSLIIINIANSA